MPTEQDSLIETEYEAVRREIADQLAAIRTLEAATLGAVGAVTTWLMSTPAVPWPAWLTPVALVVGAAARAQALNRSVELLGSYLRERELVLAKNAEEPPPRWETWRATRSAGLVRAAYFYWWGLILATVAAAVWGVTRGQSSASTSPTRVVCIPAERQEQPGITLNCVPDGR